MPKKVEDCVKSLMGDPEFKPQKGKTKEESAYAVCQAKFGKDCELDSTETLLKSTHEITLWQPVFKSAENGKYMAVLSDTSIDRDGEVVGEDALKKIMEKDGPEGYLVGLMDHENKILNQVCEWTNKRLEKQDGHVALIAEPRFFESNDNARQIKGMLDEGAKMGISIGAIVKDKKEEKIMGKSTTVYTDLELLEASFVAIPSNRHGQAMAVAKSFNIKQEVDKMSEDKTFTQKEYDAVVSEKSDIEKKFEELEKQHQETLKELEKLKKEVEETEVAEETDKPEEPKVPAEEKSVDVIEAEKRAEAAEAELEKVKKSPFYKGNNELIDGADNLSAEELQKKMDSGAIPVIRRY